MIIRCKTIESLKGGKGVAAWPGRSRAPCGNPIIAKKVLMALEDLLLKLADPIDLPGITLVLVT